MGESQEQENMASLMDVRNFFGTPGKPVSMTEMKELSKEDRDELRTLVFQATH
jgi:hypothetical protein